MLPSRRIRIVRASALLLLLPSALISAPQNPQDSSRALFELEMGADQHARRIFIPHLRFSFPVKTSTVFFDVEYIQRTNRDLQGEVDFWIRAGFDARITPVLSFEVSLNHISRHISSTDYPRITDANEGLIRLWYRGHGLNLGLGFGQFVWGRVDYDALAVFNLRAPRLFGSEFSLSAEVKFAEFRQVYYDLEFSAAVTETADLFFRGTRHYDYPATAYFGLRLKSDGDDAPLVEHLRFRGDILAWDSVYKLFAWQNIRLELNRRPDRRLLLNVESYVPVFRGDAFFGKFPPEWIQYPFCLEYEKPLAGELWGFAYGSYDIIMPLDRSQEFKGHLGLGFGLRNQPQFERLNLPVRFEMSAGLSFSHEYDARFKLGLNSVGRRTDIGFDLETRLSPEFLSARARVFAEFGGPVRVKTFIGMGQVSFFNNGTVSMARFWVGLEFFRWFLPEEGKAWTL